MKAGYSYLSVFLITLAAVILLFDSALAADAHNKEQGERLFEKLNCKECHSVAGSGGCLGPALDGVMKMRDRSYLRLRLNEDDEMSFSKLIGHPELMPHPRFKREDVDSLIDYLETVKEFDQAVSHHAPVKIDEKDAYSSARRIPSAESESAGKTLFYKNGCMSCHSIGGQGGHSGPSLDSVGRRKNRREIESFIALPSSASRIMPANNLSAEERACITDFLLSLSSKSMRK